MLPANQQEPCQRRYPLPQCYFAQSGQAPCQRLHRRVLATRAPPHCWTLCLNRCHANRSRLPGSAYATACAEVSIFADPAFQPARSCGSMPALTGCLVGLIRRRTQRPSVVATSDPTFGTLMRATDWPSTAARPAADSLDQSQSLMHKHTFHPKR